MSRRSDIGLATGETERLAKRKRDSAGSSSQNSVNSNRDKQGGSRRLNDETEKSGKEKSRYPAIRCDYVEQLSTGTTQSLTEVLDVICFAESQGLEKYLQPDHPDTTASKKTIYKELIDSLTMLRAEEFPDMDYQPELTTNEKTSIAALVAERDALLMFSHKLEEMVDENLSGTELGNVAGLWLQECVQDKLKSGATEPERWQRITELAGRCDQHLVAIEQHCAQILSSASAVHTGIDSAGAVQGRLYDLFNSARHDTVAHGPTAVSRPPLSQQVSDPREVLRQMPQYYEK